jgi:hypothetical protein
MSETLVTSNAARRRGGGILNTNTGVMTLTRSTVFTNTATEEGGGISNAGAFVLENATVSDNRATATGGGLFNTGTLTATYGTINANSTTAAQGGGIASTGSAQLANTLISNNTGGDCDGTISFRWRNLDSDTTCAQLAPGSVITADPLLGLLADNGGATLTHALPEASPAVDAGVCGVAAIASDQRGEPRPGTGSIRCDIGAFEAQGVTSAPSLIYLPLITKLTES